MVIVIASYLSMRNMSCGILEVWSIMAINKIFSLKWKPRTDVQGQRNFGPGACTSADVCIVTKDTHGDH